MSLRRHVAAFLRRAAEPVRAVDGAVASLARHFRERGYAGRLVRAAADIDDKVPCPYCGLLAPAGDVERLRTYCFACSNWGQDPRGRPAHEDFCV